LVSVELPRARGKRRQVLQSLQAEARRAGFNAIYGVHVERRRDKVKAAGTGAQLDEAAYDTERLRWASVRLLRIVKVAAGFAISAALLGIGLSAQILEQGKLRTEAEFVVTDRGPAFAHLSWEPPSWVPAVGITLAAVLGLLAAYGLWRPRRAAILAICIALIACGAMVCAVSALIQVGGDVPPELVGAALALKLVPGLIGIAMILLAAHVLHKQGALANMMRQSKEGLHALRLPLRHRDEPFPLVAPLGEEGSRDLSMVVLRPSRCPQCGSVGAPVRFFQHPAHVVILVALFVLWVLPGVFYLRAKRYLYVCRQCRQPAATEELAYGHVAVT